ncbi:MAG: hypothetical protein HKN68_02230 [Saprospiraceae bacterium]|nr:hypothetical protein [Saprospiraceae bacterium]
MKGLFPLTGIKAFIAIYLFFLFIEAIIFGPYLWKPNEFVFAFGGDALVIYYDMVYHICHGSGGLHFEGMNYPYGESILLTDANAAITILLSWVNKIIPICGMVPGILHGLILYLLPLTGIYLFLILRKMDVSPLMAIVFSILIAFLSPQMLRILGHFGLAFPFVVPMAIYWVLTLEDEEKFRWKDLLYGMVFFFFFINNPYLGFAATALITAYGFIHSIVFRKIMLTPILMGIVPTLIGYLLIQYSDSFADRVEMQWGFFHYFASIQGMFFPDGSLLYDMLSIFKIPSIRFEGKVNVGLVTTLVSIAGVIALGKWGITRKSSPLLHIEGRFKYLMWASFLLFLYAANYSLYGFAKPFMEQYLGKLLMFKASGRMAWPFYFMLTLYAAIILDRLYQMDGLKFKILIKIAILIWGFEAMRYNLDRFQNVHHSNPFAQRDFGDQLNSLNINASTYEALYMVPVVQSWMDKYYFPMHFESQFSGIMISSNTGIPMINAMISRPPMQSTLESIQLASAPHIPRDRFGDLKGDRPVLIVLGNNHSELTEGEKFIIDQSQPVGEFANCKVFSLNPTQWKVAPAPPDSTLILKDKFEISANPHQGIGQGKSIHSPPGLSIIWQRRLSPETIPDKVEISLWFYMDTKSYHLPVLKISCDPEQRNFFNRSSRDIKDGWTRHSIVIPYCRDIEVTVEGERSFLFDDLEIRAVK